jgi:hypothetical protein
MDGSMKPFFNWRSFGPAALVAGQVLCVGAPAAMAQPQTGRAETRILYTGAATRPTVESASREAQAAIRACDDRAALMCVADVLTRYAAALHEIAGERRRWRASSYKQ